MSDKSSASVRSRFAPSPTGELHLGSARTALFAWLYARHNDGAFILRIEDTDRERSTQASVDAILEAMDWMGLDFDEGPFYQTDRFDRYKAVIDQLLAQGQAYRCYCSKDRLDSLREQQMANKEKPRYDGHCRELSPSPEDRPHVIRFKNPSEGEVSFVDQVKGKITVANRELDDLIIARTDGTPTYNLTVVVDDSDMGVSEVIRGDDHVNNTPRQINIFKALGKPVPHFAHVTTILGEDGKRLSKRKGAMGVLGYRDAGYLPEALMNYVLRLGFSHGDQEVFSKDEMIACFNPEGINASPAQLNPDKLLWLNQHYMKTLPLERWLPALAAQFAALGLDVQAGPNLEEVAYLQRERCKTLQELAQQSTYFYQDFAAYEEKAARKNLTIDTLPALLALHAKLAEVDWQSEAIHEAIKAVAAELDLKMGKVAQPLRVAVSGGAVSPTIDKTCWLIGRERVLARLQQAATFIRALPA